MQLMCKQLQLVYMMFSLTGQLCNVYIACVFVDDVCLYTFNSDAVACKWSNYFYNSRSMGIGKSSQPCMHACMCSFYIHPSLNMHVCITAQIFFYVYMACSSIAYRDGSKWLLQSMHYHLHDNNFAVQQQMLSIHKHLDSQAALQSAMAVIMVQLHVLRCPETV